MCVLTTADSKSQSVRRWRAVMLHAGFWILAGAAILIANSLEFPQRVAVANAALFAVFGCVFSFAALPFVRRPGYLSWRTLARAMPVLLLLSPATTAPANYLTFILVGIDPASLQWVYFFQGGVRNALIFAIWGAVALALSSRTAADQQGKAPDQTDSTGDSATRRLSVERNGVTELIDPAEIRYFRAAKDYVEIEGKDGRYLKRITMKKLQADFGKLQFVRIHRSILINMVHVAAYKSKPSGDFVVVLKAGEELNGSRRYKPEFLSRIGKLAD